MLRGINRQDIFEETEDYARMLQCMEQMLEQYDANSLILDRKIDPFNPCYPCSLNYSVLSV